MIKNHKSAVAMMMVAGGLAAATPLKAEPVAAPADASTKTLAPCVKNRVGGIAPCVKTRVGEIVPSVKTKTGAITPCVKTKAVADPGGK